MWTYEDLTTPLIANTIMTLGSYNGVAKIYRITPIDGYVLHDSRLDYPSMEDATITIEGFTSGQISVSANYDFNANPWNLYTRLATEVPADQIFGTTTPEPEVM